MKFGLSFLPDSSHEIKSAKTYYDDALLLCKKADDYGFHSIKMTEHYFHAYGGYCPSPLMFLSAVAALTKKIRLMTGCLLPVFHQPLQLASEIAMLDVLSHGRLDVGFARAYLPYEFEAFNIPLNESRERFTETIHAIEQLLSNLQVSYQSTYFQFDNISILPRPIQQSHPPIWCAAVNARQSFSWAGEQGYHLLVTPPLGDPADLIEKLAIYRECFSATTGAQGEIAMSLPVIMADTQDKAYQQANTYLGRYLHTWADAANHWHGKSSTDYPGYQYVAAAIKATTPEDMIVNKKALVGTPAQVIETLLYFKNTFGINYFLLQLDTGGQPIDVSLTTLTLFKEYILDNPQINH